MYYWLYSWINPPSSNVSGYGQYIVYGAIALACIISTLGIATLWDIIRKFLKIR